MVRDVEVPLVFIKMHGRKKGRRFHRAQCFRLDRIQQKEFYVEVPITHPRITSGRLTPCNCQLQRQPPKAEEQQKRSKKGRKLVRKKKRPVVERRTGADVAALYGEAEEVKDLPKEVDYEGLKERIRKQGGGKR